ncbi:MAG: response regulator [Anaerolineae bacterium]
MWDAQQMSVMETGSSTILLVDDDPVFLAGLAEFLAAEGYGVITARDGAEALAVLRSNPVDLILADVAMPRMNGYQLFRSVRAKPYGQALPFVFISSRSLDSDIQFGLEIGAHAYVTKPVDYDELIAKLDTALGDGGARRRAQLRVVPGGGAECWALGRLVIFPDRYQAYLDGRRLSLSAREFKLLRCLAKSPNEAVSLQDIIKQTHDTEMTEPQAGRVIRPLVRSLRRKMGFQPGEIGCIKNVRAFGYILISPVE